MARVIVPDVSAYVDSVRRSQTQLDPNRGMKAPANVGQQIGTVLDYAEKIANNPLVVGGIDAIRRSKNRSDAAGLAFDIGDATATANEDIKQRAVAARMKAAQPPAPPAQHGPPPGAHEGQLPDPPSHPPPPRRPPSVSHESRPPDPPPHPPPLSGPPSGSHESQPLGPPARPPPAHRQPSGSH